MPADWAGLSGGKGMFYLFTFVGMSETRRKGSGMDEEKGIKQEKALPAMVTKTIWRRKTIVAAARPTKK